MKKYSVWIVLVICLVMVGVFFLSKKDKVDQGCMVVSLDLENVAVCGQGLAEGDGIKILDTGKIKRVFDFLDEKSITKSVSKIYIYLTESSDFNAILEGKRNPNTGELLTAYGWEYEDGVLGIPIYIKPDYLGSVDGNYLDAMVTASVWYFLVENKYWSDKENFGSTMFRDFYINDLASYGKTVEIN